MTHFQSASVISDWFLILIGKVFVQEWSKLRYGVFEEYGYPGDTVYPLFYYETNVDADGEHKTLNPNFGTDVPIEGSRRFLVSLYCCILLYEDE